MRSVILRGKAPQAVPAAVGRDVRLCVACLHENPGSAQSCEVCGTSLLLILCADCQVVNGPGALRCHGCGAALGTEGSRRSLARLAVLLARVSRARAAVSAKQAEVPLARRMNFARLALIAAVITVTTAGLTYAYLAGTPQPDRASRGGVIEVMPAGGAIDVTPVKSIEVPSRVPQARTEPRPAAPAAVPAAAPSASVGSAPESRPAQARVTHTAPAEVSPAAPTAAIPRVSPPDAGQKSAAGCGEAVAALGLCRR